MSCSNDKHTFCLPKLAPSLCFLASEAGKALWCLPCARTAGRESCKVAAPDEQQGCSPAQARLFCTSKKPWGDGPKGKAELAPATTWAKKSLPPPSCRAREAILVVVHENQAVTWPKGTRGAMTSGPARCCRGRQKTPRDQCQWAPGENSFLTPALGIGYSLSMGARPGSWSHRLFMLPRRCPSPLLPQRGAISGASKSGHLLLA